MQDNRGGFKKSTIVILIICGIMILAGAGIATAGIALDGLHDLKNINIAGHDINIHGTEPLAESTVSIEPFKNMDIKAEGSRVVIVDDSEFYVKARYAPGDEPLIDVQDGTLYVQDYAAIQGGSVGFTGSPDAPTGIRLTDGSGNEVTLDGDGIVIQGEDGDNVTINGLGINIHTSDDIDEDDIGSVPIDINIDGWIGAVISLLLLKTGAETLFASISNIMGNRPDAEVSRRIRETAKAVPGVLGAHDLVLHNYGPGMAIGSIHVEVDAGLDAAGIQRITHAVQAAVFKEFRVFLTIGIYAIDPARRADYDAISETALRHAGVKNVHGVFFDDANDGLFFDVLVDFTVRDRDGLRAAITADLAPRFPGRAIFINFDTDYSD